MSVVERTCPLLLTGIDGDNTPKMDELSKKLESGNESEKIEALKEIIHCVITGIEMSRLTMQVIKFCLRSRDHRIKKLLQIYWEVLDKKYPNSDKLKPEIILVCNHLLNDLKHPNEYIRGSTCRLLCRISEPEILEQLVPQVLANLEHRNSYVRKNAVLALMRIYALHSELVPDAPQRVYEFLMKEGNPLAKRNAFLMLANCDLRNALDFFLTVNDKIGSYSETMQTSILELMRKVCRQLPVPKSIFVKCAAYLLDSSSNAVVYEAANTLLSLTPLDSAINRALEAYARLLQSESDQNIKIVVINRLDSLKRRYERNLRFVLMDILRALSTPNLDIRAKILALVLELSSPQSIEDIIGVLKKELVSANVETDPQIILYRGKLVETMHQCAVKFPQVAPQVVHLLMNHLDANVIMFVKEMLQDYHELQESILQKLLENFADISDEMVSRTALWIIGEYAQTKELIVTSIDAITRALGDLPLYTDESNEEEETEEVKKENKTTPQTPSYLTRTVVLDDGTYATETMAVNKEEINENVTQVQQAHFRGLIKNGEYYLATVLSSALVKLIIRLKNLKIDDRAALNKCSTQSLAMLVAILRYGTLPNAKKKMDNDTKQRITFAIQALLGKGGVSEQVQTTVFSKECRRSFGMMLQRRRSEEEKKREESHASEDSSSKIVQFDTMINLRPLKGLEFYEFDEDDALNVRKAVGNKQKEDNLRTRLGRIHQLTGFSDPVYAEACVTVHQFDIVLDFLIVNNTAKTLQNLALELHTSGDLKLVEKPAKVTLAANASIKIQASIKVSSTENGVIFGNIVYDTTGATTDKNIVVMNCIHMDIMDYVQPAPCSEQKFREMWVEFEWENKVPVNTDIRDLHEYLDHISKITNMLLLTPTDTFGKDCQYMAANLHAKSIFGEHALMNVSIEVKYDKEKANETNRDEIDDHSDQDVDQPRQSDNAKEEEKKWGRIKRKVIGHIRIRCKSQGIALSLGEKITNKQKKAS